MDEELVTEGASLRLSCRINGRPRPRVNWYFNGRPLDSLRVKSGADSDPERGEFWLDLPSIRRHDAGVYAVVAENSEGRVESRCHVKVAPAFEGSPASPRRTPRSSPIPFAPRFSGSFNEELDVQVGDKVSFICTVQGYPRPQVTWHKDGARLHSNNFVTISCELSESGDEHKLVMTCVTLEHAGEYRVEAANPVGSTDCRCAVKVSEPEFGDVPLSPPPTQPPPPLAQPLPPPPPPPPLAISAVQRSQDWGAAVEKRRATPPEFARLFRDVFCRSGDRVTLECEVNAWPSPEVTWSFNGQPIRGEDPRFEVGERGRTYRLVVPRASRSDAGRYSLTAENDSGIATCSGLLIVQHAGVGFDSSDRASQIVAAVNSGGSSDAGGAKTEWVIFHRSRSSCSGSVNGAGGNHCSNGVANGNGTASHVRPWRP